MDTYGSLINGKITTSGKSIPWISPVTKKEWVKLHLANQADIEAALDSLQKPLLAKLTAYQKAEILHKIANLLINHKKQLSEIITLEMGKTIREARAEVDYTASYFTWFAEEAKRVYGLLIPSQFSNKQIQLRYEPIGPCAIISPWNFPLAMAGRKAAAAFAAGCPIIIKPSSDTPISLLVFGKICLEAGIPKEAIHILVGDTSMIGTALLYAPFIYKLSFTGSCSVGKYLYQSSAKTLKKLTMELGGHAPLLVFNDAHIGKAIEGMTSSKFRQSGQTCVCANRIFIQKSIYPKILKKLIEKVKKMKIGNPLKEETDLTCILHPTSVEKAHRHITDALNKGAKPHLHAKNPYEPEILTDVTDHMLIFKEETFAPVAGLSTFETLEEAIDRANQTPYGLAAYIFTENLEQAERACSALDFGVIGLNDGAPSSAQIPFGGIKASGFGREGGPTGIYEYLKEKVISYKQ